MPKSQTSAKKSKRKQRASIGSVTRTNTTTTISLHQTDTPLEDYRPGRRRGRPTLTDKELSKTIAWRRRQFYVDNAISTSAAMMKDSQVVQPQILTPTNIGATQIPRSHTTKGRSESSYTPKTMTTMPTSTTTALSSRGGGGCKATGGRQDRKLQIDFASSVSLSGDGAVAKPQTKLSRETDFLPQPSCAYETDHDRRSTLLGLQPSEPTASKRSVFLKVKRPLSEDQTLLRALSQGEDIFDTVEIPVIRKWIGPSDLHYAFLEVIPLAAACLLLSLVFLAWGLANVIMTSVSGGVTWEETGDIVVGIFKILIGVAGLITIAFHLKMGLHFLCVGYNVFLVSQTVSFITQWLEWGLALGGATTVEHIPWRPTHAEKLYMAWSILKLILILSLSFLFIIGALSSMKMIVAVGGTGWEKKTYLELLETRELEKRAQYDLEMNADIGCCPTESTEEERSHFEVVDSSEMKQQQRRLAHYTPDLALYSTDPPPPLQSTLLTD